MTASPTPTCGRSWSREAVLALYATPFPDLMHRAQQVHRKHHDPNHVQLSTLLSVKTGGCPEDCGYCPQSRHHDVSGGDRDLLPLNDVVDAARAARAAGAQRFCMGAAWRSPTEKQLEAISAMVHEVKQLGLETCVTLGMLKDGQAERLRKAGLDYYNHNLDTSREFYPAIIRSRQYDDRLDTLKHVRHAGLKVCSGGIIGMGERREDRAGLIAELASLRPHPESVPINHLVKVSGTPLERAPNLDPLEFVRTIAVARIVMPGSAIRLSAGRENMSDELQAMCFLAGANSIFYGEQLLTTPNPEADRDRQLLDRLGMRAGQASGVDAGTPAPERMEA